MLDYDYYLNITNLFHNNDIPNVLLTFNDILAKGFDAHHFIAGIATHFRNLLVCKNPATLDLLEVGQQTKEQYKIQATTISVNFLMQGIEIANHCDLNYKISQNQRLFVELALMQIASLNIDPEKKNLVFS